MSERIAGRGAPVAGGVRPAGSPNLGGIREPAEGNYECAESEARRVNGEKLLGN